MSLYELFFGPLPSTIKRHPECFTTSPIAPGERKRTIPMEVLSLGMSRTGTATLHSALTILGYETYHGFRAFADAQDYDAWLPAFETKFFNQPSPTCRALDRRFFDRALGHVGAVTDMPPASFACELIAAYPEAKIILVERDEDAWARSFDDVFIKTYESWLGPIIARLDPGKGGKLRQMLVRGVAEGQFGARSAEEFRANARDVYRRHYAEIRRLLRERGEEGRVLEFDLSEGWSSLCEFLGKKVPREEFPRVNETKMIQEKVRVMYMVSVRKGVRRAVRWIGPLAAVGVLAWYLS